MSDDGTVRAVWAAAMRVQTSADSVREVARRVGLLDSEVQWRSVAAGRFLARLAELDGIALLERAKEKYPDMPVIMVTAVHDISVALAAIRNGAYDYLL